MIVIYDCEDNIITTLEDAKSINAFKNGYLVFEDCNHYEEI